MTEASALTPIATFDLTVLDTSDPRSLAEFYCAVLGWEIRDVDDDWITIRGAGGPGMAFQLAPGHVPPTWPDEAVPQQVHLDLTVPDLDRGEEQVVALGARSTGLPGGDSSFRVFVDPAGHLFCLCQQLRSGDSGRVELPRRSGRRPRTALVPDAGGKLAGCDSFR